MPVPRSLNPCSDGLRPPFLTRTVACADVELPAALLALRSIVYVPSGPGSVATVSGTLPKTNCLPESTCCTDPSDVSTVA